MKLNDFSAIRLAFFGGGLRHFPRLDGVSISAKAVLERIDAETGRISFRNADEAKPYLDWARESLEESKRLTEYQDQKVSRLLTIVAFLTAAAAAIFAKIVETFPLHQYTHPLTWEAFLVGLAYSLFAVYLLLVACGALVAFHAIQTRFLWPDTNDDAETGSKQKSWPFSGKASRTDESDDAKADGKFKSFLFFQSIIKTLPEEWARAFVNPSSPTKPANRFLDGYYKNYVAESYLVAAKLGDKIRFLEPAQSILSKAIRVLLLWIIAGTLMFALVKPAARTSIPGGSPQKEGSQESGSASAASRVPYPSLPAAAPPNGVGSKK